MTPIQCAYHILMIATALNNQYTVKKGRKVVNYLAAHYKEDIDMHVENQILLEQAPDWEKTYSHLFNTALLYKCQTSKEQRIDLMISFYEVITADGHELVEAEKTWFKKLSDIFETDTADILNLQIA